MSSGEETFGSTLRRLRVDRGMTQKDLALAAGMSMSFVALMETGERRPGPDSLDSLAQALRLSDTERAELGDRAAAGTEGPRIRRRAGSMNTGHDARPRPRASTGDDRRLQTIDRRDLMESLADPNRPGAVVLSVRCPQGHLNPPYASVCRRCRQTIIDDQPVRALRPSLGTLTFTDGTVAQLIHGVIIGRAPDRTIDDLGDAPDLVTLEDRYEISRNHAQVSIDGWQPLVRDLDSSNGTLLRRSGGASKLLSPQQFYILRPGDRVTLADIVSFEYSVDA